MRGMAMCGPGTRGTSLHRLLGSDFVLETARTYSGSFSMAIDTALNGGFHALQGRAAGQSAGKGTVVTGELVAKSRKQFTLLSALYPAALARCREWTDCSFSRRATC